MSLEHPQAKLIPSSLWCDYDFFGEQISDESIALMQAESDVLETLVGMENVQKLSYKERTNVWLAIALSHTDLSPNALISLGSLLKFTPLELFPAAMALGSEPILKALELEPETLKHIIQADTYAVFRLAASRGHKQVLEYLESKVTAEEFQSQIQKVYGVFSDAALRGHIHVLEYIESKVTPEEFQTLIKGNCCESREVFCDLALRGYIHVLKYLESKVTPEVFQDMIAAQHYGAFRNAAQNKHVSTLEYLESKVTPEVFQDMINAQNYGAFRNALSYGHKQVLEYIESKVRPEILQQMIQANKYESFRIAAQNGHILILKYLISKIYPIQLKTMIEAANYGAFGLAAEHGHKIVLEYLESIVVAAPELLQAMIKANEYRAFLGAARRGHVPILDYLESKVTPEVFQAMIQANDYEVFRDAAYRYNKPILDYLESKVTLATLMAMIYSNKYEAFRVAVKYNNTATLNYLESRVTPEITPHMIRAVDYDAFRGAASLGHKQSLVYLESKVTPEILQEMIRADNYDALRLAAANGHKEILEYLESKVTPELFQEMIQADNYFAFCRAVMKVRTSVLEYLEFKAAPEVFVGAFVYLEQHLQEYGNLYINPLCAKQLARLRLAKEAFELQNPNGVFDISDKYQAQLLFYMIRHLIRLNNTAYLDDIHFLLNIPAVKALAHSMVTKGVSNELVRLALQIGNQKAAELLINIPAVRQVAEQNQFYANEVRGGIDLRALAQNAESAMTALAVGEQQLVNLSYVNLESLLHEKPAFIKPTKDYSTIIEELDTVSKQYKKHLEKYTEESDTKLNDKREVIDNIIKILNATDFTPEEKMQQFEQFVIIENNGEKLKPRRDGSIIAKTLEYFFHILTFGIFSKISKNSFAFWKSHGEVVLEDINSLVRIEVKP